MRSFRIALLPILSMFLVGALAWFHISFQVIAHFDFIWDVLLGAALGASLALLPSLAGFPQRRNAATNLLWISGFVALLVIFFQYMMLVTDMHIKSIHFLLSPSTRLRIVEGAYLGYCSVIAGRGRI